MDNIVVVSWQSDIMPAPAYNYYHKEHFAGTRLPKSSIRETQVEAVTPDTICCGCWERIRELGRQKNSSSE